MAAVRLIGDSSGYSEIKPPAVANNQTFILPASGGTFVTTSGAQSLVFAAGSASAPAISPVGDSNTGIFFPAADTVAIAEGGTESIRLDSSGRLLVGTSTSRSLAGANQGTCQIETAGSYAVSSITTNSNDGNGAYLIFGKSRGTSLNSNTAVTDGDEIGGLYFAGANGSGLNYGASIICRIDGAVSGGGVGDMPSRLVFSTTADGASSPTERMRIKSDGSVVVTANNTTALTTSYAFTAAGVGLFRPGTNTEIGWFGGNSPVLKFNAWWDTGIDRLQITDADYSHGVTLSQNSNAWGSYSDARLKQDIVPLANAIDLLQSINPYRFKWKSGLQDDVGFIAQELKPILPEAVDGEESDFKEDEDGRFYGAMAIKYEKLIPVLTAALQEAIAKIETLETKVAALEAQ